MPTPTDPLDDLVRLRPPDPAVPDWQHRRARLRTEVLTAARPQHRRAKWLAPAAAAVVAALLVGGGWTAAHVVNQSPLIAGPASPTTTAPPVTVPPATPPLVPTVPDGSVRVIGSGLVQQRPGEAMMLCVGAIGASLPAACGTGVPLIGIDWDAIPDHADHGGVKEALVEVVGLWDGQTLSVESLGPMPASADTTPVDPPPSLCDRPTGTRGEEWVGGHGPDRDWLQSLPGYQQMWTNDAGTIIHLATTADPTETERLVRERYKGLLCVGTVPGPTWTERSAARDRVGAHAEELGVLSMGIGGLENGHTLISLTVLVDTDEVRLRIAELVGSEMATWTRITGSLRVIR